MAVVALPLRPRPAGAGGFLIAFAAWWLVFLCRAAQAGAEIDRSPSGFCEIPYLAVDAAQPLLLLALRLALTAVALRNDPMRGVTSGPRA